jgi:uncharacterized protein involved in outer membrane biogenesis
MIKKILIAGFLVFLLVLGAVFVYLNNVYIPKYLKPIVVQTLEENLKKHVTIEKALYFPFRGVLFSGIEITNLDLTPFVRIETLDFSLKSFPSIKKSGITGQARLLVSGVNVRQQQLIIKGSTSIDLDVRAAGKDSLAYTASINLESLEVRGLGAVADITKIEGTIICTQSSFASEHISAVIGKQTMTIVFKGIYDKTLARLEQCSATYGKTALAMNGIVTDFQHPRIDAAVSGTIALADVSGLLVGISIPQLGGECVITAKAAGILTDISALSGTAQAEIAHGSVGTIQFSDLRAAVELKEGTAYLTQLRCIFYEGAINGTGKAVLTKADIPVECSIDVEKITIGPLVRDVIGQDMGTGSVSAHAGAAGSAADLNSLTGSGWFNLSDAVLKAPENFAGVARGLGAGDLARMEIHKASATFTLSNGKAETQDFIAVADEATVTGKGSIDLEQYIDFEAIFRLSQEFAQGIGNKQLGSFISDSSGFPVSKIKLYGKIPPRWKIIPLPVEDILKDTGKQLIMEGLKGLFKK